MKLKFIILFLTITNLVFSQKIKNITLGNWHAELALNDRLVLPFNLKISNLKKFEIAVINAAEEIQLTKIRFQSDSIHAYFPEMDGKLVFKVDEFGKYLRGYWLDNRKHKNIKIPLSAYYSNDPRFSFPASNFITQPFVIDGRWEVKFSPDQKDESNALGIFKTNGNTISGTFQTETGDYRFLEGNISGGNFALSSFDGAHAYVFTGEIKGDSINGVFYSGSKYRTTWTALRNENASLRNPDSLSYLISKNQPFVFNHAKQMNGKPFLFSSANYQNKVVIIQIMGTWCPNCLDETKVLKELYNDLHTSGLEIISVCYEADIEQKKQLKKLKDFKKRSKIPYTILYGGLANKELASSDFGMLNQVMSFPTSIFIGKDGNVWSIHTGFNGPATGKAYIDFKNKIRYEIEIKLDLLR
jgi:thiol-disulfide isomerase/thioredoxin